MIPEEQNPKVHHMTAKGARVALAEEQISRASYEAILAGTLSLAEARELGRDRGPDDTGQAGNGPGTATETPRKAREHPQERSQESTDIPRPCLCGCGESVRGKKSRFRPGHDARLHGELKRNLEKDPLLRNERFSDEQRAYARERGLI
jgi:hypothetical protein